MTETGGDAPTELSASILAAEADREARDALGSTWLDESELPGVGDKELSLREGIAAGGFSTIGALAALDAFDALDDTAAGLLAPEIQETLGVSDAVIATITAGGAVFSVVGGLVFGRFADRGNRTAIVGLATMFWSGMVLVVGLAQTALWYFLARATVALGRSQTIPVQGAILADSYPIGARARIFAIKGVCGRAGGFIAPLAIGALVDSVGGNEAWRWGFFLAAAPTFAVGLYFLAAVRDPPRGQFEQKSTIGEVLRDAKPGPISMGATFKRIMQIRTLRIALAAFIALGFSFVAVPIFLNLYLDERFQLSAFERAVIGTLPGVFSLITVPLLASRFDRFYRKSPTKSMALIATLFFPMAAILAIQMNMPTPLTFAILGGVGGLFSSAAFALIQPVLATVNPYRMRAMGSAIGSAMIIGIGGVGGAILAGLISDATSERVAVISVGVPAYLLGGLILLNGARFIRHDLSLVVEEIREEQQETQRMRDDPDNIPVLQARNIDFSYGSVQVLFDVEIEVARGESLALLGTNGAGKSTLLRVVTGLGIPSRGVVRLNGRNMTLASAEQRVEEGIVMLAGGRGVFAPMTIQENLETAAFIHRRDAADVAARLDRAYTLFPELAKRPGELAGNLSGGQQQMLALASVMMHDPEVLLIDELSLGLAPTVVQSLLEIVERLREQGQTMVIVEQSLNIALTLADRAMFMEKGQVRFTGSAESLLQRDDLARAVFLGRGDASEDGA